MRLMKVILGCFAVAVVAVNVPARAQSDRGSGIAMASQNKSELRARFEQRYPDILRYKSEGKIGETSTGFLEAVKSSYLSDSALKQLIEDENADRRALYELIAKEEQTTSEVVARRAGKRNFERARKGDFLKEDGTWRQK